jgi:hypothetical protein
MQPLAQDTPLQVEQIWLAGLRRGPLWRLRTLVGMRLQAQGLGLAYLQRWAAELDIAALLHQALEEAGLSGT